MSAQNIKLIKTPEPEPEPENAEKFSNLSQNFGTLIGSAHTVNVYNGSLPSKK